jgi:hypothetical protein
MNKWYGRLKRGGVAWRGVAAGMLGAIAALWAQGVAWALASCPVYPALISKCCVANQPGQIYALNNDLSAPGECIDISAPNIYFLMNGKSLTGPGATGIGVHVLSTASNVIFSGQAPIQEFAVGFQTDAPNTLAYGVEAVLNGKGIVFNGPGAFAVQPVAEGSSRHGIVLTSAASGSFIWGAASGSNSMSGFLLNGVQGVTLRGPEAVENGTYGIWFKGASFNTVIDGALEGNTLAGAYLGCNPAGPSVGCATPPSNGNTLEGGDSLGLYVGSCPGNSQHNQPYGVAIDKGNVKNHVYAVKSDTNGSCVTPGDTLFDGYDGNPGAGCAGNFWLANSMTTETHAWTLAHPTCMN